MILLCQLNSGALNEEDVSPNVTDSAPDNNVFDDNVTSMKEENDFELDSEQDDPTGKNGKIIFNQIIIHT